MKPFFKTELGKLYQGDCFDVAENIPNKSLDLIITSPPYFQQRDYGVKEQIGWEKNINQYIDALVNLFYILGKKLKPTGTIFINIGDKYINKSLQMIPEHFAIAMQKEGFIHRNTLIWKKASFLPTTAEDRFIVAHEPIYFFTVNQNYYFRKRSKTEFGYDYRSSVWDLPINKVKDIENHFAPFPEELVETILNWACPESCCSSCGAPHFPVYEKDSQKDGENTKSKVIKSVAIDGQELGKTSMFRSKKAQIERRFKDWEPSCECGKNSCDVPAVVYDPFMGAGTVADVCESKGIGWAGSELNPEFCLLIQERVLNHKKGIKIPKHNETQGGLISWDKINVSKKASSKKD